MSYINPLHPPVIPARRSQFTTLGGALDAPPSHPQFLSPFRRHLPQLPYTPSSKWKAMTGRSNLLQNPISFDFIGYSNQGVPMRELSTRGAHALAAMIHGAEDSVLAHTGLLKITLRIQWPGYEHVDWARTIELTTYGHITRSQLGATVSNNFARFVEKTRSEHPRSLDWHLGPSGIRFEHLVLVSLYNVFEDVWQAEVAVDLR